MTAITEAGGVVISAAPGFYNHPQTMDDLIDFVVGKVLDVMGIGHGLVERWGHKRRG
jgi:flavin prenyltransferase